VQEDNTITNKDQLNMETMANGAVETERMQQALAQTLKLMEMKLALPNNNLVSQSTSNRPITVDVQDDSIINNVSIPTHSNLMANHVDELEDGHIVNHVEFLVEGQVGSLMNQAHEQVDTTQLTTTSNDEITESTTTNGHTSTSVPEPTDMIAANQEGTMGDISPTHNRVSPTHAQYVDEFLESISLPLQQPLIQEGFQTPHAQVVNTSQGHPHNSTQRKSTRFAKKGRVECRQRHNPSCTRPAD
jgi:hypothetical protein